MRVRFGLECRSALPRLAMVGLVSGLAAACSTDSARLSANPFSSPFSTSSGEPTATGALPARATAQPAPVAAVPTAPVTAQPLAPPAPSVAYNQPPAAPRAAPAPVPAAPRAVASNGPAGWTPHGGSAVVVGQGDTLQTLSTRYGVPGMAILQANGLTTASQLTPGRTVVIPVFNAVGAPAVASAPARPAPVAAAPARPQPQMRLVEGPRPARAEPARTQAPARPAPAPVAAKPQPAPARVAAKPEPARPEPRKAEVQKAVATRPVEAPRAAPVPAQAQMPAPAPAQPQAPQRVAALGTPPVSAPAPAPTPAPAPQRPEAPTQSAALPSNPGSGLDFRWPARGRVISGFGNGGNEGINIAVPEGTPVRAAEGGTVAYAGSELKGYGNLVLIRHDNGYVSAYAHNGEISVKRGDKISRGQVIAKSGQSGNVNSPQLHFEIRKGSTPVDPMPYLSN